MRPDLNSAMFREHGKRVRDELLPTVPCIGDRVKPGRLRRKTIVEEEG